MTDDDNDRRPMPLADDTNAMHWAIAFKASRERAIAEGRADDVDTADEGFLVSWFANAIETGRRHPDTATLDLAIQKRIEEHYQDYPVRYLQGLQDDIRALAEASDTPVHLIAPPDTF
jgi:hypothetical protein